MNNLILFEWDKRLIFHYKKIAFFIRNAKLKGKISNFSNVKLNRNVNLFVKIWNEKYGESKMISKNELLKFLGIKKIR